MKNSTKGIPNLYDLLGVNRNATSEEIKKSYEQLVMEYSDKYRGKPEIDLYLNALFDAYMILKDPDKRNKYNSTLPKKKFSFFPQKKKEINPNNFLDKSPTFTQLLEFNWEDLEEKIDPIKNETPEQKKAFWDALGFKAIVIMVFLILLIVLFWALK